MTRVGASTRCSSKRSANRQRTKGWAAGPHRAGRLHEVVGRGRNMDIGWFRNCRKSSGSNLAEVVLTLKAAGGRRFAKIPLARTAGRTKPGPREELLLDLGALKVHRRLACVFQVRRNRRKLTGETPVPTTITAIGRKMLAFPLHPRYSRMLLAAHEYGLRSSSLPLLPRSRRGAICCHRFGVGSVSSDSI